MDMYPAEGLSVFRAYAVAVADGHAVAHELAQCEKIDVYKLLAADLFTRVNAVRKKSQEALRPLKLLNVRAHHEGAHQHSHVASN
jgi:hypothetical protein